ncbi:TMV resistance protein N-like [Hibiscus syriacus]|uniref:TMV resistance protein N-like n=1 Tax=Hibiscus syriacus TaxID=106335 RepID=UPI00192462EF|nr:TMV resistance protein N-like [Hibiscus syriacus]
MASSFNYSSCKLKYSSFPTLQLEYSSSSSLQLKCSSSSSRRLKYSSPPSLRLKCSSPPSRRLKYFSPLSRRLKYSSPPSCRLKDFPSSSRQIEYQVFLSFRGEDARRNFTTQLLQVLKDTGMNAFYDEEKLERGKQLSLALSQAISASDLSIIILSADYASSKSCLAELSDIMDRMRTGQHIVLPIFYYVDPSDVQNLRGSFKSSFNEHESTRPLDEVKRWKGDFAQVGKLKGIHIKGDRRGHTTQLHQSSSQSFGRHRNKCLLG